MLFRSALVGIDKKSGEIRWMVGNDQGWSEALKAKLLKPVGPFQVQWNQHNPRVNANGPIYGSPEESTDLVPALDPVTLSPGSATGKPGFNEAGSMNTNNGKDTSSVLDRGAATPAGGAGSSTPVKAPHVADSGTTPVSQATPVTPDAAGSSSNDKPAGRLPTMPALDPVTLSPGSSTGKSDFNEIGRAHV